MARAVKTRFYKREVLQSVYQACMAPKGPLARGAAAVEGDAKTSMRTGGRDESGKTVAHSAAEEPPFVQSGNLRASITHSPDPKLNPTYIVGPTMEASYGAVHEFGGRFHEPRPFMRPALRRTRRRLKQLFRKIKLALTVAGRKLNAKRGKLGR